MRPRRTPTAADISRAQHTGWWPVDPFVVRIEGVLAFVCLVSLVAVAAAALTGGGA